MKQESIPDHEDPTELELGNLLFEEGHMEETIGGELEAGFTDSKGNPVDTLAVLGGGLQSSGWPFEAATSDMALSSLELITTICKSGQGIEKSLNRLLSLLPKGHIPVYQTKPFGDRVPLAKKSRVLAMTRALAREHPNGASAVSTVAPWCSTQYHIGTPDLMSNTGVLFLNLLNNAGPYARQYVIRRFKVAGAEEHLKIWHGWANPDRLPAPRWFGGVSELETFVAAIPKLITKVNGEWVEVNGGPSRIGDPESEGVLWWVARPRVFDSGSTIEWRSFPSLSPRFVAQLADEILMLVWAFRDYVARHSSKEMLRESGHVHGIFAAISKYSPLVPPRPLTDDEWWKLFFL